MDEFHPRLVGAKCLFAPVPSDDDDWSSLNISDSRPNSPHPSSIVSEVESVAEEEEEEVHEEKEEEEEEDDESLEISRAAFTRVVDELMISYPGRELEEMAGEKTISADALDLLHRASESYLVDVLELAQRIADHSHSTSFDAKDVSFAARLISKNLY